MERRRNYSRKRDAILACVRSTDAHPTAEWVYRQIKLEYPDISLGTVYRNLSMFKQEGIIGSVCIEDGMERFDRTAQPHAHFICNCCHCVQDLMDLHLPDTIRREAAQTLQAKIDSSHLIFRGQCARCQEKQDHE